MHPVTGAPDSDRRTEHHLPRAAQVSHSHHAIASYLRTCLLPGRLRTGADMGVAVLFACSLVRFTKQKQRAVGKDAAARLSEVQICTL